MNDHDFKRHDDQIDRLFCRLSRIAKFIYVVQPLFYVIVVTHGYARVPHGIYWLSSDVDTGTVHYLNCAIWQILAH